MKIKNMFFVFVIIFLVINLNGCIGNENNGNIDDIDMELFSFHIFDVPGIVEVKWLEKDNIIPIWVLDPGRILVFVNISIKTNNYEIPLLEDLFKILTEEGNLYISRDIQYLLPDILPKKSSLSFWVIFDIPSDLNPDKILYSYMDNNDLESYGEAFF